MACTSSQDKASSDVFARPADGVMLMDSRCDVDVMG